MPRWIAALVLIACAGPLLAQEPEPLVVRYTTWMIVPPTQVAVESRPYGMAHDDYTYRDQPSFGLLSLDGETLDTIDGRLGETTTLTVPGEPPALLRLSPGNNYSVPRPEGDDYWYVATPDAPLNVVGGFQRLHFWLPPGLSAGTVLCHAFSVGEAGRLVVSDLEGTVLGSLESDFNEPEALLFRLPGPAPGGALLQLALLAPETPDWTIDDAKVWLGPEIPGLLAATREAADAIPQLAARLGIATDWTLLRDFEDANPIQTIQWSRAVAEGAQLPAYDVALSGEQSVSGGRSLRVALRFPEDYAEPWQELKLFTEPLDVSSVRRVRFFLYGDGSGRNMIVRVRDASQEHHYVNVGAIDWTGWKAVIADFEHPSNIAGGDENRRIDGPPVSVVIQIQHSRDNPPASLLYIDDLAVEMGDTP